MNHPPLKLAWTVWGLGALLYLFAFYQRVAPAVMTDKLMAEFAIGGAALGGPLLGSWSQRLGRRKPLYLITGVIACAGWAAAIFLPLPLWLLVPLLIAIGFASGNIIIGFAWAKESLPLRLMGTASGVVNMGPLMGGMLLQPGVGWLLDKYWNGAQEAGVRLYNAATWQTGFALMFATVTIALLLVPLIRETHCRQAG